MERSGKTQSEQVTENLITFVDTKSGKNRSVPVDAALAKNIKTKDTGRLFKPCYEQFRRAVKHIGLQLPDGQLTPRPAPHLRQPLHTERR
jgi:hypothetical protein